MGLDFSQTVFAHWTWYLDGAWKTIMITMGAVGIGIFLGFIIGMGRIAKHRIFRWPADLYVEIIRGTPMLLQLYILYFGFPQVYTILTGAALRPDPFITGMIGLGINSGAYVAEIVRAGIQSIKKGQMEAARSLGLTHGQAMWYVILPQAFRVVLPPLGNEFIVLLKDSSLVSTFGYVELMRTARIIGTKYYAPFEPLIAVAVIYLVLTFTISRGVAYMERRLTPKHD